MWPSGLTLAMTLTLNFQGQIWNSLYLSEKWSDCHETKSKHIYWSQDLKCDHRGLTLDMTSPLNFQGQIWNSLYLSEKWSDCHETKSKHIDWSQDLKCDHRVWPWTWPWPWISRSNMELAISLPKMVRSPLNEKQTGPIATKRKANILIWTLGLKYDQWVWPWWWPWINIWILKVIGDLDHLVTKVRCKDLPDSDWGDFRCRRAVDSSSYIWSQYGYRLLCHFVMNDISEFELFM